MPRPMKRNWGINWGEDRNHALVPDHKGTGWYSCSIKWLSLMNTRNIHPCEIHTYTHKGSCYSCFSSPWPRPYAWGPGHVWDCSLSAWVERARAPWKGELLCVCVCQCQTLQKHYACQVERWQHTHTHTKLDTHAHKYDITNPVVALKQISVNTCAGTLLARFSAVIIDRSFYLLLIFKKAH